MKCDVLIVGSGVTGALIAFHLAEQGVDVVVVDRRNIAQGSTPASTALLLYDLDIPLNKLRRRQGQQKADAIYRCSRKALDDMALLVERLHLNCALRRRPSLFLADKKSAVPEMRLEAAARRGIGLEAEYVDAHTLSKSFGITHPGGILSGLALEIDPWKFTLQVLRAAERLGCRLYSKTMMRHGPHSGTPIASCDGREHHIEAKHIVWATGYETPEEFKAVRRLCKLTSTYVVATRPLPAKRLWPERALIWDSGDPYLYARTTVDRRVIIGGEDEPFVEAEARDKRIGSKTRRLLQKFAAIYPLGKVEVETAWAGTFAQTQDQLPYIGVMDEYPNCYFALGYGGNGITLSLVAAQIIRDAILDRRNPAADLFSFNRHAKPRARLTHTS